MVKTGFTLSWLRSITNQANNGHKTHDRAMEHYRVIRNLETHLHTFEEYLSVEVLLRTLKSRARIAAERGIDFLEVYKLVWMVDYASTTDFILPSASINATHLRSKKSILIFANLQAQGLNPVIVFSPSTHWRGEDDGRGHCTIVIRW